MEFEWLVFLRDKDMSGIEHEFLSNEYQSPQRPHESRHNRPQRRLHIESNSESHEDRVKMMSSAISSGLFFFP